ncbi:hypothetical protein PHYPSEUDO_015199 [Phytophthora pseudosyringae]|uniref:Uncharacterized protein n=1 Tax=Phytophthora pseudosyringae TaxID=221518 RepID=A0A8T1V6S8_9STRA|nr:hypothetical protein PHYPSEUDO_015199 [Phytophthora pseudosyringae]
MDCTNQVGLETTEALGKDRASENRQADEAGDHLKSLKRRFHAPMAHLNRTASVASESEFGHVVHRLVLESDVLRTENVELRKKLQLHERLESLIQVGLSNVTRSQDHDSSHANVYEASEKSQWTSRPNTSDWRVHFLHAEPSFYVHPLNQEQFDASIKTCYDTFNEDPPPIKRVGTLFGWDLHYAPLTRSEAKSVVSLQFLQEFEKNAYAVVCNIPGPVHLRYPFLLRRVPRKFANGKRSISYLMTIAQRKTTPKC